MLINMLKKQFHEVNLENLKVQTQIKKRRKEKEKAEKELQTLEILKVILISKKDIYTVKRLN